MIMEKFFVVAEGSSEIILWLLLVTSVISLGFILERFFTLGKINLQCQKFQKKAADILQYDSFNDIEELAKDRDTLPGRALSYGLRHAKAKGELGMEEVFNSFSLIERSMLERNLNFLATVGANATFIGLLGTVLGIMKAFNDLSNSKGGGNEAVMQGIAHALVATAIGLFVAIPAVISYNYFQKLVRNTLVSVETAKQLCLAYTKKR